MERLPGEGDGNPLQYSCLGNPMDRGGWQATAHEDCKRVRHDFIVDLKCCVSFRCTQSDTILCVCVCVCVYNDIYISLLLLSCSVMSDSLQPTGLSSKNTGMGCCFLLQGIFPSQGSNPCLLYYRQILLPAESWGSPCISLHIFFFRFFSIKGY